MTTLDPAPIAILELVKCGCKACKCANLQCKCMKHGLKCTDLCTCGDDCENIIAIVLRLDDLDEDSDDEEL